MQSFEGVAAVFILHLLVEHFDGHDFFDEYFGSLLFHWGCWSGCGDLPTPPVGNHPDLEGIFMPAFFEGAFRSPTRGLSREMYA
jgi:hypothetical protein